MEFRSSIIQIRDGVAIIPLENFTMMYNCESNTYFTTNFKFNKMKVFNNRVYDYYDNKITSYDIENESFKERKSQDFVLGSIFDLYRYGKIFKFVKKDRSKFTLLLDNKKIEIGKFYSFVEDSVYFIEDKSIVKINLESTERSILRTFDSPPIMFCLRSIDEYSFLDKSNNLTIVNGNTTRNYHWLNNRSYKMIFYEDSVLVATTIGTIIQFYMRINKKAQILSFNGIFIDFEIYKTTLIVLTDVEIVVFDLESNCVLLKRFYTPKTNFYNISLIEEQVEKDIFDVKRRNTYEIRNLLNSKETSDLLGVSRSISDFPKDNVLIKPLDKEESDLIVYSKGSLVFLIVGRSIKSIFKVETNNIFISNEKVIVFSYRKSTIIANIYKIFIDKLVLINTVTINTKEKFDIDNAYFIDGRIYISMLRKLFLINKTGILEEIFIIEDFNLISQNGFLYCLQEKGIYDIIRRQNIILQKKIQKFAISKDYLIFYIENIGIYLCLASDGYKEKYFITDLNIIDLKCTNYSLNTFSMLHIKQDRHVLSVYNVIDDEDIKIESIEDVDVGGCIRIISAAYCLDKFGRLIKLKLD